jgi:glycosyltransferase involved in cell wall biosynthesis
VLLKSGIDLNDIRVLVNIPRGQLYEYLYASDVLVLPHRSNTFHNYVPSLKLIDYMASGKPIVAYSLLSVSFELRNYPLKILVTPNEPAELAKGILDSIKQYKDAKIEGFLFVKKYDWNEIVKTLLKVYRINVYKYL